MRRYNLGSQNAGDKESKAEENFQVSTDQGEPFAETYIIKQDRDIFVPRVNKGGNSSIRTDLSTEHGHSLGEIYVPDLELHTLDPGSLFQSALEGVRSVNRVRL